MTKEEELRYLVGLTRSAASWRLSEGDERSPMELEVASRLDALLGIEPEVIDGRIQAPPVKPMKDYSHPNRVRVSLPGGKKKWVTPDKVKKVPYARSKTGFRYVLKEEADVSQN